MHIKTAKKATISHSDGITTIAAPKGTGVKYRIESEHLTNPTGWEVAQKLPLELAMDTSRALTYKVTARGCKEGCLDSESVEHVVKVPKLDRPHTTRYNAKNSVLDIATSEEQGVILYTVLLNGAVLVDATESQGATCRIPIDKKRQGKFVVTAVSTKAGCCPSDTVTWTRSFGNDSDTTDSSEEEFDRQPTKPKHVKGRRGQFFVAKNRPGTKQIDGFGEKAQGGAATSSL